MNQEKKKSGITGFAAFIVDHRRIFFTLFLILFVFSLFSSGWVTVEGELAAYLPSNTDTARGMKVMEDFITYASADVMVRNLTEEDAEALVSELSGLEGVSMVTFDASSDSSFRDGNALLNVTLAYEEEDDRSEQVLESIEVLLDTKGADYVISTEVGNSLSETIAKEIRPVIAIVIIVLTLILLFTCNSFAEVLVLLITLLTAVVLHMGTNFLFSSISFVSNSVSAILQLALSLDYSIILCNRYREEHRGKSYRDASVSALAYSIPAVTSSSLTTVAGLAAMTMMQFRLGADMGLVLIKAIIISLVTVFFLMPGLLVVFGKAIDKTGHKKFVPSVSFLGKFAYKTYKFLPPVFFVVVIAAFILAQKCSYVYSYYWLEPTPHQSQQEIAQQAIEDVFGEDNVIALIVPAGDLESEKTVAQEIEGHDGVKSVTAIASTRISDGICLGDPVSAQQLSDITGIDSLTAEGALAYYAAENGASGDILSDHGEYSVPLIDLFLFIHDKSSEGSLDLTEEQTRTLNTLYDQLKIAEDQLQTENYSRIVIDTDLPLEADQTENFLDQLHVIADQYYDSDLVYTVGDSTSARDMGASFENDNLVVSVMSILFVMLILLFTFRSYGLPLLLILVIEGSISINFAAPTLLGTYVFFMDYLIVSAIQMGSNIDYAIVVSERYLDFRKTMGREQAITEAMNLAFPTILTSGSILIAAAGMVYFKVSEAAISGLGHYLAVGTIITVILVLFILPQVLLLGDTLVQKTTLPQRTRKIARHRFVQPAASVLLAVVSLLSLAAAGRGFETASALKDEISSEQEALIGQLSVLEKNITELDLEKTSFDEASLSFAESSVVDSEGQQQLEEGESEYASGAAQLAQAQSEYDAGAAQLALAKQEYAEGQQQLEDAREQVQEGEAKLAEIQPLYERILPLYNYYLTLQNEYDTAVASGDLIRAAALKGTVDAQKLLYETELTGTGYSIESLIEEYESGQLQLEQAKQQIADGEAQLESAAAQIAAGEAELAAGKEQLDAGYAELQSAASQLEEGRQTLAENKARLLEDLEKINAYDDKERALSEGTDRLLKEEGIAALAGSGATYSEVCNAAHRYLYLEENEINNEVSHRRILNLLLGLAGLFGLLTALSAWIACRKSSVSRMRLSALTSIFCGLCAFACAASALKVCSHRLADGSGSGILPMTLGILLLILDFAASEPNLSALNFSKEAESSSEPDTP